MQNAGTGERTALADRPAAWRRELDAMVRLAAPIVLTQLGWVAILTTDIAMIGRLGADALAGASLSLMAFFLGFVGCAGVVMATAGLAAQAYGARRPREVRRVVRQGLWVTAVVTLPIVALFGFAEAIFTWLGEPAETLAPAGLYMSTLKWALPTTIAFAVLRNFVSALNRPLVALWVMLAGALLNAFLDYALIFGHFGLPRLELVGAGIATATVNAAMFLALLAIAVTRRPFKRYAILANFWRPDWRQFRRIFRIGLPIAGTMLMEGGFFIAAVFVAGQFGATVIAAHMIAMQMPHITFMVPLGLATAATVRVGQAAGRGDAAAAYRAGWVALVVILVFMSLMTVIVLAVPRTFASAFLDQERADSAAVLALATTFLFYAAVFQMADGIQAVAAGALRGLNDTTVPMLFVAISFWVVGVTVALSLAFPGGMGGSGLWIGFDCGLGCIAALLTWRLRGLARRRYLPSVAPAE